MKPTFFATPALFRKWFEKNHKKASELLVGFYKTGSGKPSITWPQSVDEALCFGWIDGVRRSIDGDSYSIRFTPRKPGSIWSAINIKKVAELTAKGLMKPEGLAAFEKRRDSHSKVYSFEQEKIDFDPNYEKLLKANKKAWTFFDKQVASYKKPAMHWVMSAKQEATRLKRLDTLIECSAAHKPIPPMKWLKNMK